MIYNLKCSKHAESGSREFGLEGTEKARIYKGFQVTLLSIRTNLWKSDLVTDPSDC